MTPLEINVVRTENNLAVVMPEGEIDSYSASGFREKIVGLLRAGDCFLIISLAYVTYLDASGYGVLVGAQKLAKEKDGEVIITSISSIASTVFKVKGLNKVFRTFNSVEDAEKAILSSASPEPSH